jgi:hypothetical protein
MFKSQKFLTEMQKCAMVGNMSIFNAIIVALFLLATVGVLFFKILEYLNDRGQQSHRHKQEQLQVWEIVPTIQTKELSLMEDIFTELNQISGRHQNAVITIETHAAQHNTSFYLIAPYELKQDIEQFFSEQAHIQLYPKRDPLADWYEQWSQQKTFSRFNTCEGGEIVLKHSSLYPLKKPEIVDYSGSFKQNQYKHFLSMLEKASDTAYHIMQYSFCAVEKDTALQQELNELHASLSHKTDETVDTAGVTSLSKKEWELLSQCQTKINAINCLINIRFVSFQDGFITESVLDTAVRPFIQSFATETQALMFDHEGKKVYTQFFAFLPFLQNLISKEDDLLHTTRLYKGLLSRNIYVGRNPDGHILSVRDMASLMHFPASVSGTAQAEEGVEMQDSEDEDRVPFNTELSRTILSKLQNTSS